MDSSTSGQGQVLSSIILPFILFLAAIGILGALIVAGWIFLGHWIGIALVSVLGVEAPEGTRLVDAVPGFPGGVSIWFAILLILTLCAAVVGIFLVYALEQGTLGWIRRSLLILLRAALVALVVLLLFRPVLRAEFAGERPRGIVVLLDNTASMNQQDRRVTDEDLLRVAIAKGAKPLDTKVSEIKSLTDLPTNLPKDPSRADMVRWMVANPKLKLEENLSKLGPLRPLLFGAGLEGIREEEGEKGRKGEGEKGKDADGKKKTPLEQLIDKGTFTTQGVATALADSVDQVLQRKESDLPAAIIIISDGQENASKIPFPDLAQKCKRLQVPLYIYGVGASEGGNLRFKEVQAPDTLFVEDTVGIPIRWLAQGFKTGKKGKSKIEIALKLGGEPVELIVGGEKVKKKVIDVENGQDLRDILYFTVAKRDKKDDMTKLVASIKLVGDDRFKDTFKDEVVSDVRIVDRKIKVLVIENSPRFEYKFLQPALLRDRRIEPTFLLVNADPRVANAGPPYIPALPNTREKFFEGKYNVIVLGDVAPGFLGKDHLEWIREFVEKRGGLIVVAGRQYMPAAYKGTVLEEVLPVEFNAVTFPFESKERPTEYQPTLTDAGLRSSMLSLDDTPESNLKIWQSLPGFYWEYPVTKLRPGATALVVNPLARMNDSRGQPTKQPMPLIATQFYGQGQVLFCGSDETWRWRFNVQDKYFVRYWGQIIYQMGLPHLLGDGGKHVQFSLQHAEAVLNQPSYIYVRMVDKDFNPRKDEKVEAELIQEGKPEKRKIILTEVPGRKGEYRALMENDIPGKFELKLTNPGSPGPEVFSYRVDVPKRHELEEAGMAEKELRDLATQSGGKFYREEDLYQLAGDIEQRKSPFQIRQEVILWNPLVFLLFLGLITAEWLVRKFSNLS